jgi:hypothetical protein
MSLGLKNFFNKLGINMFKWKYFVLNTYKIDLIISKYNWPYDKLSLKIVQHQTKSDWFVDPKKLDYIFSSPEYSHSDPR